MCVTKAQLHALRVMAKTRLLWPTTWAKERYEQVYLLPDSADWDLIHAHISDWIAESEVIELCNSQLVNALETIATNIRLSSCCFEGGSGLQQIGGNTYYGTATPLSPPTVFGPGEEFETEAAWETHKCEVANGIVNGLIGSLNGVSLLTLTSLIASSVLVAVVGIGLIAVPPVAAITACIAAGLTFAFFSTLATEIGNNRQSLVCLLYNANGAIDAYDQFKAAIEQLSVDLGLIEVEVGAIIDLVMQYAPVETFNALYEAIDLPPIGGDTVDCQAACTCPDYDVFYGTFNETNNRLTSQLVSTYHRGYMRFNHNGTAFCGPNVAITVTLISGAPASGTGQAYIINDVDGNPVYSSDTIPPAGTVGGSIYIRDAVAPYNTFVVQVDWSPV